MNTKHETTETSGEDAMCILKRVNSEFVTDRMRNISRMIENAKESSRRADHDLFMLNEIIGKNELYCCELSLGHYGEKALMWGVFANLDEAKKVVYAFNDWFEARYEKRYEVVGKLPEFWGNDWNELTATVTKNSLHEVSETYKVRKFESFEDIIDKFTEIHGVAPVPLKKNPAKKQKRNK